MSKISQKRRKFTILKRRKRRKKVKRLKERYLSAKSQEEKERILKKLQKITPYYSLEGLLKK